MTDRQLMTVGWGELSPSDRRRAIRLAVRHGKQIASYLWQNPERRKTGDFTGPDLDLYEFDLLAGVCADKLRYWRSLRLHPPTDLRPIYYLDAYSRQLAKLKGEVLGFSRDDWQAEMEEQTTRHRLLQDAVLALMDERDRLRRAGAGKSARDAQAALDQGRGFLARVKEKRDRARIHHYAAEHAPVWLGTSLEAFYCPPPAPNREEQQADALNLLGEAIRCEIDLSLCDAAATCLSVGIVPGDDRLRELLAPYADALGGDPRLDQLVDALSLEPTSDEELSVPSPDDWPIDQGAEEEGFDPSRLPEELREKYQAILPLFQGKRVAILGIAHGGHQANHWQQVFRASKLLWFESEDKDSRWDEKMLRLVNRAEIGVSITRWARRRIKRAYDEMDARGIPYAIVARGNSTAAVIEAVYDRFIGMREKRMSGLKVA